MISTLQAIIRDVTADVEQRKARRPLAELKELCGGAPAPRDATAALCRGGCSVIAEIKRASPIKGPIRGVLDQGTEASELAAKFADSGARLIGCHTERRAFQGSLEDLAAVRRAVSVPIICRDIMVDPYQIHEARLYGTDVIPLLVSSLGQAQLESMLERVEQLGMTAMVEVHSAEEASRAVAAGATVIGVNARNLQTLTLNRNRFAEIAPCLPASTIKVALSGVRTPQDLMAYAGAGADAVVIGTGLVASEDPAALCRALVAAGQHPSCPSCRKPGEPRVH